MKRNDYYELYFCETILQRLMKSVNLLWQQVKDNEVVGRNYEMKAETAVCNKMKNE